MKTLKQLFEHQIQDLYSAEDQLTGILPDMARKASDTKLKEAFEDEQQNAMRQRDMIKDVCSELEIDPKGEKCNAMEGLVKEAKGFMKEDAESDVMDAGLIADAQRIAHYEISGFGTAKRFAQELGYNTIAGKLDKTLQEKYETDKRLNDMAEDRLNNKAK